jgi:CheY-like chemotaxis protein
MSNVRVLKSSADGDGVRIFVAGNDALEIFWLEMVFKGSRMPYTLEVASDGQAVKTYLEQLAAERRPTPDLILFDTDLPAAPPIEILERLAADSRVPLFLMVCKDELITAQDRVGSRRCFHKPFTYSHLESCLAASRHEKSSQ